MDDVMVNINNLEEYISFVLDATLQTGISRQVEAFKSGLNQAISDKHLQLFTEEELERLLCGEHDSWLLVDLFDHIKFDHGYTGGSTPIINLLEVISEFTYEQRRAFLQFVTGAHRLPPGGLAALNPKLTIVRKVRNKPIEPPKKPEKAPFFLPSVPSLSGDIMFKPSEETNEELKDGDAEQNYDYMTNILASPFLQVLQSAVESKNFSAFTDYIKGLSPSSLDMELRMIQIIDDDDESSRLSKRPEILSLDMLLDYLIYEISCRNNFEFVQAVVRLFLKGRKIM